MDLAQLLRIKSLHLLLVLLICMLFEIPSIGTTISPSSKGKKPKAPKELKVSSGPVSENVFDRGLVDEEPMANDILIENAAYYKDTKVRQFNATILGYVTPVSVWRDFGGGNSF